MRTPEDHIKIKLTAYSVFDLDWERIETDPGWIMVSSKFDIDNPEEKKQALFLYLGYYIAREQLFDSQFVPCTNGPADLHILDMEVVK